MNKEKLKEDIKYCDWLINRVSKEGFKLSTKIQLLTEVTERKKKLIFILNEDEKPRSEAEG